MLIPLLARVRDQLTTVKHIIVAGDGDASALGQTFSYEELLEAEEPGLRLAHVRRTAGRGHVLHVGHHRQPEGRGLQPSLDLPALDGHHLGLVARDQRARPGAVHRPDVPRQRLGDPLRRLPDRCRPGHAPAVPAGRAADRHHRPAPADPLGRGAHHLERPAPLRADPHRRPVLAADDHRRRSGRAPTAHRAIPGRARDRDGPGLGHDRDQPAVLAGPPAAGHAPRGGDRVAVEDRSGGPRRRDPGGRRGRIDPAQRRGLGRRVRGPRPLDQPAPTTAIRPPSGSTTVGCAPGTSGRSTGAVSCRSATGPRT